MQVLEERVDVVEERVDRLEAIFGQFMAQTGAALLRIDRSIERMEQTVADMQAVAQQDREQWQRERRELARQLGNVSNRMGTIVEDIIAPSLRRMAREELGCGDERFFAERIVKRRTDDPSQSREFDALYVGEQAILLNETKAIPRPEYARDFVDFLRSDDFFDYFPEYQGMPLVPVFSSIHLPADLVTYLTRQGIYAVAMGEEVMEVLNLEEVRAAD